MIQKGCWCRIYETKVPLLKQFFKGLDLQGRIYIRFYSTDKFLRCQISGDSIGFHSMQVDNATAEAIRHYFPFIKVYYK